ncbi:MAG: four helix bundle protein [Candidatus Moranbacteria bacterium]|nr:four helix bundle protein [Candidatus Moranbacteria bacterium]
MELSFTASYLPPEPKIILLGKAISRLDILKFFAQIAWENKLIHTERYANLSQRLEEIGRMLGGWRKGLQKKTLTR